MGQLLAIIRKELKLLLRDMHGLALLFVMPIVFILIMSMAMKQDFDRRSGVALDALVYDESGSQITEQMLTDLAASPQFSFFDVKTMMSGPADSQLLAAEQAVGGDRYNFLVVIPPEAFASPEAMVANVLVAPATSPEMTQLFVATLNKSAAKQKILLMEAEVKEMIPDAEDFDFLAASGATDNETISVRYGFQAGSVEKAPTSVQQNVPAWLVFSMFFVVVPLANTLINERQLGTLRRIRTIPVASWKLIAGKIVPYYFINQIQVALMLFVGVKVVPMLGGDSLTLGDSVAGLLLISSALSIAALGYAILVAVICRSTEQATTLGGAGNIILAALGGIMVPTFIMPEFMQAITVVSPMSWGLQGFLDIFLRGGGVAEVWPKALSLVGLGLIAFTVALYMMRRQTD